MDPNGEDFVTIPIDMRQASRGEKMTNIRREGVSSGGAPGTGIGQPGDPCPSLAATHVPAIAQVFETRIVRNGRGQPSDVVHSLRGHEAGGTSDARPVLLAPGHMVRRLTPTECLRLMGAPDDFLDLDPPLSDSAKYRLCGNGVVVPVAEWIGKRLLEQTRNDR